MRIIKQHHFFTNFNEYYEIMSELLKAVTVHPSWRKNEDFFKSMEDSLLKIEEEHFPNGFDWKTVTPEKSKVLRFLETNLEEIKVVILGQDPYPQKGVATGRAFEVNGLGNWYDMDKEGKVIINKSLENILKGIFATEGENEITRKKIKKTTENDSQILPPNKWFEAMEKKGVLFLNTAFTCKINESDSHKNFWSEFTKNLIAHISKNEKIYWLLWGSNAKEYKLYSLDGILLQQISGMEIDLSHYSAGVYLLSIDGQTTKIIKK